MKPKNNIPIEYSSPGDLNVGDLVTIYAWYQFVLPPQLLQELDTKDPSQLRWVKIFSPDATHIGEPLRVRARQLPFVAVEFLRNGLRASIDTRRCEFMHLRRSFVNALQFSTKPPPFTPPTEHPPASIPQND